MKNDHHWASRFGPLRKVDPAVAAKELRRIWRKNGKQLHPRSVVDESVPQQAPLHEEFTWSDPVAADNWRLHEARNLIRSVEIELDDGDRQPVFHHVTVTTGDQTERYYQERVTLAQRTDEYSLAMTEAAAYLEGAVARYRSLMTLARTKQRPSQEQEKLALLHQTLGTARVLASQLQ